jgi:mannose-6-phosphate isomerase-like protein (cupin superfamily)
MPNETAEVVSIQNAAHYQWGDHCDGWHLVQSDALSIIQERMPAGASETRHYHQRSRQFFFILSGEAALDMQGERKVLKAQQGIEVPPGVAHQMHNPSETELVFVVVSTPKSHGDRVEVP